MPNEFLFDTSTWTKSALIDQLMEAEHHIPGLVCNYPPISAWNRLADSKVDPEHLWRDSTVFSFNLYIHIPFCAQKCSFCYYSVAVVPNDSDLIWAYLKCLEKEAEAYSRILSELRVETVFVGGGTPSRLNEDQMQFLFERIIARFDLSICREITYECSPDTATKSRIDTMVRLGTNRISMGVQTLDSAILEKTRRPSDTDQILTTYYNIVDSGVRNFNIDLIAGVEREAFENMERTMDAIANLRVLPKQITLFTLSVREGALDLKTLGSEHPRQLFGRSLTLFRYAKRRMMDLGYWQYSRNLYPQDDWIFHYQDNHWGNNGYVLALGASGYSHSHRYTYVNEFNFRRYMDRINDGYLPVEKTFELTAEESLRRHLVLAMKHATLDIDRFNSYYPDGDKPLNRFDLIWQALSDLGIIRRNDKTIRYTSEFADVSDRFVRLFYSDEVNRRIRHVEGNSSRSKSDSFAFTV